MENMHKNSVLLERNLIYGYTEKMRKALLGSRRAGEQCSKTP